MAGTDVVVALDGNNDISTPTDDSLWFEIGTDTTAAGSLIPPITKYISTLDAYRSVRLRIVSHTLPIAVAVTFIRLMANT